MQTHTFRVFVAEMAALTFVINKYAFVYEICKTCEICSEFMVLWIVGGLSRFLTEFVKNVHTPSLFVSLRSLLQVRLALDTLPAALVLPALSILNTVGAIVVTDRAKAKRAY